MIKFFRHIRQTLIEQGKMGKYFKYAIGEIVLVVIGILIALQINNWNEERKEDATLKTILRQVNLELENNIKDAESTVSTYVIKDSLADRFLNNIFNSESFDPLRDRSLVGIMFNRNGFDPNNNAIDQLLQSRENKSEKIDSILSDLKYLRTVIEPNIQSAFIDNMDHIADTYREYLIYNTDWFSEFYSRGTFLPEKAINHFLNDPEYRNNLSWYRTSMTNNYAKSLRRYAHKARILHSSIAKLLGDSATYDFTYKSLSKAEFEKINKQYLVEFDNERDTLSFEIKEGRYFLNTKRFGTGEVFFTNPQNFYLQNGVKLQFLEDGSIYSKTGFNVYFNPITYPVILNK